MATVTTPQSPRALFLSVLLHASLIGTLLLLAWCSHRREEETPQIFELVAGEGSDYAATEAPTTAMPPVKVDLPEPLPPVVTPASVPAPVIERVPEPKAPPKQETPPPPKKIEPKAEPKTPPKKEPERVKYDKFVKETGLPKQTQPKAQPKIKPKLINADAVAGRVASDSTNSVKAGAGGTAMTRAETDLWDAYIAMLLQRIRRAMEAAGMTDQRIARVEFRLSTAGAISSARIIRPSGSSEFDAAVLQAFRTIGALGPPPTGGAQTLSVEISLRERH